jgi:hypothetical protein
MVRAFLAFLMLISLTSTGLRFPELETDYRWKVRTVKPEDIPKEFRREGNTLPEWVVRRHAIYDPTRWASLKRRTDGKTGYQYFQEKMKVEGYGDVYLIAITINTPLKDGLQAALDYSRDNFGYGKREVELKIKRDGRESKLKEMTGTILPNSLYRGWDSHGNEVYGYQVLLEMNLPKPVSDRKFILRVLNHYLPSEPKPLVVSEWYQGKGEGEFKYLRGCDTFYPIDRGSHLLTIKFNGDIGGVGGGLQRVFSFDSIAESYLRRTAFGIKERAERGR